MWKQGIDIEIREWRDEYRGLLRTPERKKPLERVRHR